MTSQNRTPKTGLGLVSIFAVVLMCAIGWGIYHFRKSDRQGQDKVASQKGQRKTTNRDASELLELTPDTIKAMHLKTIVAEKPRFSRVLRLRGSLAIDSNRLSHVHARFPGQIVELATIGGMRSLQKNPLSPAQRALQNFDEVTQGTPMAVIWSKDLGEKKSQLADSLATLRTDKKTLEMFKELTKTGGISDREYREQKVKVEKDEIAAFSAEAILRTYQVTEAEITQVKDAAEKVHLSQKTDNSYSADWPKVVVSAPIGGVIVDKAVTVGEIVDANANLFKIADLSVLSVWLHPYEEDLPALEDLPKPLKVAIKIPAHPELGELEGNVDRFSPMIDPNEHMALLIGTVKNPNGALLAGQFITAEIGIPADTEIVQIPAKAVIDFGSEAIVFVQPDTAKWQFHRRRVLIVQRNFDFVHVRGELTDVQRQKGLQALRPGEAVVAGGILELEDYLEQQQ